MTHNVDGVYDMHHCVIFICELFRWISVLVDYINFDCGTDNKVVVMVARIGIILFLDSRSQ